MLYLPFNNKLLLNAYQCREHRVHIYVTQHDKTHENVPEIKQNELLVSYERATLQLFNGEKLYPSCILLESYGLWKLKNNETTISRKTH